MQNSHIKLKNKNQKTINEAWEGDHNIVTTMCKAAGNRHELHYHILFRITEFSGLIRAAWSNIKLITFLDHSHWIIFASGLSLIWQKLQERMLMCAASLFVCALWKERDIHIRFSQLPLLRTCTNRTWVTGLLGIRKQIEMNHFCRWGMMTLMELALKCRLVYFHISPGLCHSTGHVMVHLEHHDSTSLSVHQGQGYVEICKRWKEKRFQVSPTILLWCFIYMFFSFQMKTYIW